MVAPATVWITTSTTPPATTHDGCAVAATSTGRGAPAPVAASSGGFSRLPSGGACPPCDVPPSAPGDGGGRSPPAPIAALGEADGVAGSAVSTLPTTADARW